MKKLNIVYLNYLTILLDDLPPVWWCSLGRLKQLGIYFGTNDWFLFPIFVPIMTPTRTLTHLPLGKKRHLESLRPDIEKYLCKKRGKKIWESNTIISEFLIIDLGPSNPYLICKITQFVSSNCKDKLFGQVNILTCWN